VSSVNTVLVEQCIESYDYDTKILSFVLLTGNVSGNALTSAVNMDSVSNDWTKEPELEEIDLDAFTNNLLAEMSSSRENATRTAQSKRDGKGDRSNGALTISILMFTYVLVKISASSVASVDEVHAVKEKLRKACVLD